MERLYCATSSAPSITWAAAAADSPLDSYKKVVFSLPDIFQIKIWRGMEKQTIFSGAGGLLRLEIRKEGDVKLGQIRSLLVQPCTVAGKLAFPLLENVRL